MPSENSNEVKRAFKEILTLAERKNIKYLDEATEEKLNAEIQIQYGFGEGKAKKMIDAMVLTGRLTRVSPEIKMKILEKEEKQIKRQAEEEVFDILSAKPTEKKEVSE